LDRIEWASRIVYILFDADVNTNRSVESARWRLANELELRGAKVFYINLPVDVEVNGIDDLLFRWGPERVLELFECPQAHCLILSPGVPLASAREFVAHNYTQGNRRVLNYHKDVFYVYTGTHYREADDLEVRRSIYTFLEKAKHKGKSGKLVRFHPNKTRV
jgi:hypothetical protein